MRVRSEATNPECFLLSMLLSDVANVLDFWEDRSDKFLKAVVDIDDAVQKILIEGSGHARHDPPRGFNARLKDLFLEVCVVADLADRGLTHFFPAPAGKIKNHDFNCTVHCDDGQPQDGCLEVNNLRSPVGIVDAFVESRRALVSSHPGLSKIDIVLTHHWDNTVDEAQIDAINSFVEHLRDRDVPSQSTLNLPTTNGQEVEVRVNLNWGEGRVAMVRPIGGDFPTGPFIAEDRLFEKAVSTIEKAAAQLESCFGLRLLALNFDTPDAMLSSDFAIRLQGYVNAKWSGAITLFVFLQYRFLECNR
ncbi:hypothetical protein [Acidobacterium sp. S8]|uniref:hypothetical protein n=1 Tax=Acidobacterium sp. S8 TaxID=1641854 RepID=UPI001C206C80|nr:hypothetical protein [Acidobacterium sp. S8]